MSGAAVSRILESALPPDLKFTAVVFASFANDDGSQMCPALSRVAYLRGLEKRRVQNHVKELRRMEILELTRPASQWHAATYALRFDHLPSRAPYRPPERQRYLLGPPPRESGVQPTAPLSGVQPATAGVQPTAPDPSVRSVSTHTYHARARAAVQPTAPLTADPVLPLVGAVPASDHAAHAWCGRICVPKFLHRQFKKALGGPIKWRPKRLRAFYHETLTTMPAAKPIADEPVKFWRKAFTAWCGGAAVVDPAVSGCGHDRPCQSYEQHRTRIHNDVEAARQQRKSG